MSHTLIAKAGFRAVSVFTHVFKAVPNYFSRPIPLFHIVSTFIDRVMFGK